MPNYSKAPKEVCDLARDLMDAFHPELIEAGVRVDILMAFPNYDEETGEPIGNALMHQCYPANGIARIVSLKDRTKGMGDAEICLDGHHWEKTWSEEQQRALLDHELQHIAVRKKGDEFLTDDIGRPKLRMRKHTVQVGWFADVAARHGAHSFERTQAASIMETHGQFFWPEIAGTVPLPVQETTRVMNLEMGNAHKVTSVTIDAKAAKVLRQSADDLLRK